MAEVHRAITDEEKGSYMPFDELLEGKQKAEVYEAVGAQLMMHYEIYGLAPPAGDLLVKLSNGEHVIFSYEECVTSASLS